MLQRLWRCSVDPDRIGDYEEFARTISIPMFQTHHGYRGCVMARRCNHCEVLTLWDDEAAIKALEASAVYRATVAKIRDAGFIRDEVGTTITRVHALDFRHAFTIP